MANILASKFRVPPIFILLAGAIFQVISTTLMSTLPVVAAPKIYGYEILLSIGIGFNLGTLVQMTPQVIPGKDQRLYMSTSSTFEAANSYL